MTFGSALYRFDLVLFVLAILLHECQNRDTVEFKHPSHEIAFVHEGSNRTTRSNEPAEKTLLFGEEYHVAVEKQKSKINGTKNHLDQQYQSLFTTHDVEQSRMDQQQRQDPLNTESVRERDEVSSSPYVSWRQPLSFITEWLMLPSIRNNRYLRSTRTDVEMRHNVTTRTTIHPMEHRIPPTSGLGIWYWFVSAMLVLFAGVASGLTVGFLSLDPVQLKVLETEGTSEQKRSVRQVSGVIRRHHLLLVTLLLANSIAMEALPIFLDRLVPSWAAILISVTAILLFGEIIPQALCTGKNQLHIAQIAAPFVSILIGLFFMISWPIAKLLDFLLGDEDHHSYYARAHLKALIRMHERERRIKEAIEHGAVSDASSALGADEVVVIEGALDLATKTLKEIMLPIENVFMLDVDTKLNRQAFTLILSSGHSRIPVYQGHRNNIKGLLLSKALLAIDPNDEIRAGDLLIRRRPIFSSPDTNLYDLLNEFQKGHSHIAFVTKQSEIYVKAWKEKTDVPVTAKLMGIATLEDVIEELIQEEIYDEFDEKAVKEKAPRQASLAPAPTIETSIPTASSVASHSSMFSQTRKLSSHTLLLETSNDPSRAINQSSRDLPQIVRQLSQELPVSERASSSSKRFGPSSAKVDSFPATMTVPLTQSTKVITPTNGTNSVIIATTTPLSSKLTGILLMDELNKVKRVSSSQALPTEEGESTRRVVAKIARGLKTFAWSETPENQQTSDQSYTELLDG